MNIEPRYNGRATFVPEGEQEQIPHPTDRTEGRPIFAPEPKLTQRIREALPGHAPLNRPETIQDVAARVRFASVRDERGEFAVVNTADLEKLLAYAEKPL